MGEVYAAEDKRLGRKVALKFLPAAFVRDERRVSRFEQEARVMSVAFSRDGKRIASGEEDKSVNVYTRHRTLWGRKLD